MSPNDKYKSDLNWLNENIAAAARELTFTKFVERLDRDEIKMTVSYADLVFTDNRVEGTVFIIAQKLPCSALVLKRLIAWKVPLDGYTITKAIDNFLQLRIAWARASGYEEDLPNFERYAGAYFHFAGELSLPDLQKAVNITFTKTKLKSPSERGKYFAGICHNMVNTKR